MMATWPPTLADLKNEMELPAKPDVELDARLTRDLNAAVAYVQDRRPVFRYDQNDPDQFDLPDPTDDHVLGTLRLAARWRARGRSPDGLVSMGELGTSRVSSVDVDIDRLLRIGKFAPFGEQFA